MLESYAYLHLALDTEAPHELQNPFKGVNWKKLSTHTYSCFLCLAVILAVFSVADTAQALLTVGDAGSQVRQVQQRLRELGYFHANTTGYYGPITHHAVLQFQRDHGISADGMVGDHTLSALKLSSPPHPKPNPKPHPEYNPIANDRHLIGLGVGDQGPGVKDLQKRLKELGFFHTHPTGYFGSITREAVIQFQKKCSIAATGLVTENTLAALNSRGKGHGYPTAVLLPARFLRLGDVGATVGLLQQRLLELGYYHGLITESYDSETAAAVRKFQVDNGIQSTGMVGPTTLAYIREKLSSESVPLRSHQRFSSEEDATQYLQRKLRPRGYSRWEIRGESDLTTPDREVTQKGRVDVTTWYGQTQVEPRIQSASLPPRFAPVHPFSVTNTFLELGDAGKEVRDVQRRLRALNFYNGPINGFYNPTTERAVIRFQRANRITQTGVVGPTTRIYLFNAKSAKK